MDQPKVLRQDSASSSSISSVDDTTNYFEKPLRTLSEDTVITPPPTIHIDDVPMLERKLSHKLSSVSFSDMNDISLDDVPSNKATTMEAYNPLKIITSALVSGKKPQITTTPVPTRVRSPTPPPKDTTTTTTVDDSSDTESIASTRSIFTLWSPFRSSSSLNTSPASSRRPSKQNSAPAMTVGAPRPSDSFVTRQKRLSRPTSIISPLPGFQEALLAQMEQLNYSNTSDPKSKVIKNLKRQSIRHSLVSQNKGDDYDWGEFFILFVIYIVLILNYYFRLLGWYYVRFSKPKQN